MQQNPPPPQKQGTASTVLCPVALLLPNDVDYLPLCYGVSRSTVWLNVLEACSVPATRKGSHPSTYYHVCASLLNTNLPSNAMLRAALEASSATVIILHESMVPLLFSDSAAGNHARVARLSLPPHVKTILLWKASEARTSRGREHLLHLYSNLLPWTPHGSRDRPTSSSKSAGTVGCDLFRDIIAPSREAARRDGGPLAVLRYIMSGGDSGSTRLLGAPLSYLAMSRCAALFRCFKLTDPAVMIFTSGTTGLPKAAKFSHLRYHAGLMLSRAVVGPYGSLRLLQQSSRVLTVYNCLPLYHSAGGVFCPCHLIHYLQEQTSRNRSWLSRAEPNATARMVIRKKFTASGFARDLEVFEVTTVQYIGELLRYALEASVGGAAPSSGPDADPMDKAKLGADACDRAWVVPFAFGNGLRADVWQRAKAQFRFGRVVEFYASTEGNVGFCNYYGEPFAVGHVPVLPWPFYSASPHLWRVFPMVFCRFDTVMEEPLRDASSHLCIRGVIDEPCEVLGVVTTGFDPLGLRRFDGYLNDAKSTQRKLTTDVLRRGDCYFRTGDLLRFDKRGFVYFVDRVGDTFRWKGENVSTLEVANAINEVRACPVTASSPSGHTIAAAATVVETVVFGVSVPQHEGRAGMARLSVQITLPTSLSGVDLRTLVRAFITTSLYTRLSSTSKLASSLPRYAIPVFLRVGVMAATAEPLATPHAGAVEDEMTATFKHRKHFHQALGFKADSEGATDLFYLRPLPAADPASGAAWRYELIDEASRELLERGVLPAGCTW